MFADYRNVFAIIVGVGILQLAGGLLGLLAPLGLSALGVDPFAIGLIAAVHAAGFMAGAATAPAAITAFGNIRVFSAAAALAAAGVLMMQLYQHPAAWTAIRIVHGAGFAWMFASAEAWLSQATPARNRGAVTGFYHVVAKAALLIGPFFAAGAVALDSRAYLWCGVFLALSLAPMCLTRRGEPPHPETAPLSLASLFKLAPAAVIAAFMAGVINSGTLSLLPVFAVRMSPGIDLATQAAALAMAAAWLGGLLSQWPAGRISDHVDRRLVVAVMAGVSAIVALLIGLMTGHAPYGLMLGLLALWGGGSLSFYGIAVAHAIDRSTTEQIARVMSGLLFVWAAGSVVGPPLSGLAFRSPLGPGGLFILASAFSMFVAIAMLTRRTQRDQTESGNQERWEIAQPTSVAGADIDPRS